MAAWENVVKRLRHLIDDLSGGPDELDQMLRVKTIQVGRGLEASATEAGEQTLHIAEADITIVSAAYYPDNALTANNTNYATLLLGKADGAGGAVTAFDSFTTEITGSGDWVQGTPESWTIVESTDTLTEGQALMFVETKAAAGVVLPAGTIIVKYRCT
jgi:hypothetical protein